MRQPLVMAVAMVVGAIALAPRAAKAQSTTTAQMVTCKDGTTSKGGQGACSHHGGIATASATGAMATSTPGGGKIPNQKATTPAKTGASADSVGAIAQCTDGMFWDGTVRPGACSGHKGVKRWLAGAPAK